MGWNASLKASSTQIPTTPPSRGNPVDNRVRGGRPSPRRDMRAPGTRSRKDGRWRTSTLGDGVSKKTPRGRQRETTSLISQETDNKTKDSARKRCVHEKRRTDERRTK